jgi:hypothetical protein
VRSPLFSVLISLKSKRFIFALFECFSLLSALYSQNTLIDPKGITLEQRFKTPKGFSRIDDASGGFDNYLRTVKLKEAGAQVYTYNGKLKQPDDVYEGVLDFDIGTKDLQQCADAVMRLRAEFLYSQKQYDKIHFNFTNGKKAEFVKYAEGYRFNAKSNTWSKVAAKDYSYKNFRNYLDLVFSYAGSLSLSRELKPVASVNDIKPGDVFIKGGSPGHAVIVMDVAINSATKEKIFLIAQSYMPAQHIHILKNFSDAELSPWYRTNFGRTLRTPEWDFSKDQLMRFED